MMYLSTSTSIMGSIPGTKNRYTTEQSLEAIKKAGYDHADVSLWSLCGHGGLIDSDDWECSVEAIAEKSAVLGLPVYQSHGNTHSGLEWDDPAFPDHDYIDMTNMRCLKATKMLGAHWMVMHPYNLPHEKLYSRARGLEVNLEKFAPFIEEAKRLGIGIAIENMVDFSRRRRRYCGGDIFELIELVDTIGDPAVGICYDTGHANESGMDTAEGIRAAGKRIKCLHINDNRGVSDEHIVPYFGTIKWADTVHALKEIGYEGDFAYEIGSKNIPAECREEWLKYTAELGRKLMAL